MEKEKRILKGQLCQHCGRTQSRDGHLGALGPQNCPEAPNIRRKTAEIGLFSGRRRTTKIWVFIGKFSDLDPQYGERCPSLIQVLQLPPSVRNPATNPLAVSNPIISRNCMQDFPVQSKGQRDYWGRPKGGGANSKSFGADGTIFFEKHRFGVFYCIFGQKQQL